MSLPGPDKWTLIYTAVPRDTDFLARSCTELCDSEAALRQRVADLKAKLTDEEIIANFRPPQGGLTPLS